MCRIERCSVNNYYTPSTQISSYSQLGKHQSYSYSYNNVLFFNALIIIVFLIANSSAGWVLSSPPMLTSRESQYIRHAPYPSPTLHHKGADPSEYYVVIDIYTFTIDVCSHVCSCRMHSILVPSLLWILSCHKVLCTC